VRSDGHQRLAVVAHELEAPSTDDAQICRTASSDLRLRVACATHAVTNLKCHRPAVRYTPHTEPRSRVERSDQLALIAFAEAAAAAFVLYLRAGP
jgi:hypothetical protein